MTKGMREGLAALCVAGAAAVVAVLMSRNETPAENGIYTVAVLVAAVFGIGGFAAVAVSLARQRN